MKRKIPMHVAIAAAQKEIREGLQQERAEDGKRREILSKIQSALSALGVYISIVGGRVDKRAGNLQASLLGFVPSRFKDFPLFIRDTSAGDFEVAGFNRFLEKKRRWRLVHKKFNYAVFAKNQANAFRFWQEKKKCEQRQRQMLRRLPESLTRHISPNCTGKHSDKFGVGCLLKALERAWFDALEDS